ncbi:MAG: DUF1593 domain-containing protein [Chryseobacterium sp.]
MKRFIYIIILIFGINCFNAQKSADVKPRILISTDIGGTDPDDNQSIIHLLMYADKFNIEGLVSSPSFGNGSKAEILKMIDFYEKDLPKLKNTALIFRHQNIFAQSLNKDYAEMHPLKDFQDLQKAQNGL